MNRIYFLILCLFLFVTNSFAQITEEELASLRKYELNNINSGNSETDDHPWKDNKDIRVTRNSKSKLLSGIRFAGQSFLQMKDAATPLQTVKLFLNEYDNLLNYNEQDFYLEEEPGAKETKVFLIKKYQNKNYKYVEDGDYTNTFIFKIIENNKITFAFGTFNVNQLVDRELKQNIDSKKAESIAENKIFAPDARETDSTILSKAANQEPRIWIYKDYPRLVWVVDLGSLVERKGYQVLVDAETAEVVRVRRTQ